MMANGHRLSFKAGDESREEEAEGVTAESVPFRIHFEPII